MAHDLWRSFGFSGNPYQSTPLRPVAEDYALFIGREDLGAEFRTQVECDEGCVAVIAGDVGVGKTSFLNVQQYLLFTALGAFGPRLVPALELTPLIGTDSPEVVSRRVVHNAVKSVESFCTQQGLKIPKQLKKISKWLSHAGSTAGFDFGLTILGTGGNIALAFDAPPVSQASLENWRDVLGVVASETIHTLGYNGIFAVLDNAENLENEQLTHLLMAFRDTLFMTKGVWWVVIGQSGLYSFIDAADKRVSQRIQGNGLQIPPLTADELHEAIERRIQRYRAQDDAVSPISRAVHTQLYEASRGEIRFVMNTSDSLVRKITADVRQRVLKTIGVNTASEVVLRIFQRKFDELLGDDLIKRQIPDEVARTSLREMTMQHLKDLRLRRKELQVLAQLGDGEARASDHQQFRVKTMQDFSSNYLTKMFRLNLLHRRQAGRSVYYGLRGYAALAKQFGLFEDLIAQA